MIKFITLSLLAYGQKSNVSAVQRAAEAFLKEEADGFDASWFQERPAAEVHQEILDQVWDPDCTLKKPTASQQGIAITLPEVNERMAREWLEELKIAKTCVVFVHWHNPNGPSDHQYLILGGEHWFDSRSAD
ncbi:MAG: hypothetical protein ACOCXA_02040 [Planctomycetota bacterium]